MLKITGKDIESFQVTESLIALVTQRLESVDIDAVEREHLATEAAVAHARRIVCAPKVWLAIFAPMTSRDFLIDPGPN